MFSILYVWLMHCLLKDTIIVFTFFFFGISFFNFCTITWISFRERYKIIKQDEDFFLFLFIYFFFFEDLNKEIILLR